MIAESEFVVLGAGLAGLAAAASLGSRAVVLEREDRPGGLVRSERFGEYWFDHVIHLLYFPDRETEERVQAMDGHFLAPCPPCALVQFSDGAVPFPFQLHLKGLPPREIMLCVRDFADASLADTGKVASSDYEALLLRTFGRAMCERFFLPYNRKMWRRAVTTLAPMGFQWNLQRPSFDEVMRGAIGPTGADGYNARGWYPRPPAGAPRRGMEVLARSLAARTRRLCLGHRVERIDLAERVVTARGPAGPTYWRWANRCLSSLPLPSAAALCADIPAELRDACIRLPRNRVRSIALSIEGPRPTDGVHWRYYPDESLIFTRLVYMCEFDPNLAPPSGWGLLVEVPERAEDRPMPTEPLIERVRADLGRIAALAPGCRIIDVNVIDVDPAYVVFTPESRAVVDAVSGFLREGGVDPVGRFGRWEYSSMAQVIRDGFQWADSNAVPMVAGTTVP